MNKRSSFILLPKRVLLRWQPAAIGRLSLPVPTPLTLHNSIARQYGTPPLRSLNATGQRSVFVLPTLSLRHWSFGIRHSTPLVRFVALRYAAAAGRLLLLATCSLRHPWLRSQVASCHRGRQGGGILPPR